jgi:predicted metalloprotease
MLDSVTQPAYSASHRRDNVCGMTFNPNADIRGGKTRRRGRTAGIAAGGVGVGAIAILLVSQLLGVDLTGLVGGGSAGQTSQIQTGDALENCQTSTADRYGHARRPRPDRTAARDRAGWAAVLER